MTLAELQALVAKKEQARAAVKKRMADALAASEAEGVTAEAKAKHLADFDAAEAELPAAEKELARATALRDAEQRADAHDRRESEPARARLVTGLHNPAGGSTGRTASLPASVRRHGSLKAFRGADADLRAYQTGLFVAGCFYGHQPSRDKLADFGIVPQATLNTTDNSLGGYFVPEVMDNAILVLTEEFGIFRRLADVVPMTSDTWSGPRWANTLVASWVAEGSAPAAVAEPKFDRVQLVAKNLTAFGKISNQLNEDALINLGDVWANAAAIAFAFAEDDAGFNGDGTSGFGGCVGLLTKLRDSANAASLVTAASGRTTLASLTLADYWAVIGRYPSYPGAQPRWLCHKEVWAASMGPLQTAAGGVTEVGIQNGGAPRFLGYPVEFVNAMPKAASFAAGYTGIAFGDLSLSSKFGDRRQRSLEVGLVNDDLIRQQRTLFTSERVDVLNHTITDPKNGSNAGPVLGLRLAAS